MPEIDLTGVNEVTYPTLATWRWEVALDLFCGGLVAGLLVFSGIIRLSAPKRFPKALFWSDLLGFPVLGAGMFLLWLDLDNRWKFWQLFTTFKVTSPMSWGSWIILFSSLLLGLRFLGALPLPSPRLFAPLRRVWLFLVQLGLSLRRYDKILAGIGIALGLGLGFYTGVLLSTIPARPLWNSLVLAPLFLVSGLGTGGAFLWLVLPEKERRSLMPYSLVLWVTELALVLIFTLNLAFGTAAAQRSVNLLFEGGLGWAFWGLVVLLGLIIPVALGEMEFLRKKFSGLMAVLPSVFKLVGGLSLRLVIVYAGLLSFV